MGLLERVREVEGLNASIIGERPTASLGIEELRHDVRSWTSLEAIAAIMVDNPQRARNELRSACRQALSEPKWTALTGIEKRRLTEELIDVIFGMGPIEALVEDESITEIMVNGSQSIFFERDGKLVRSELSFENDEQVRVMIDRIIGPLGRRIDEQSPMVDARLPQGHRVNAVLPPITPDGPHLTIRAFARRPMTLEEMRDAGSLDDRMIGFLGRLVAERRNVVVSGGTGSGKTTLLNAFSLLISQDERIITIEDSAELRFEGHGHVVRMEARPRNAEGEGEIAIRQLVINALRMRPDRIIVGECRSGEAIDMLQAMLTGHDGSLTTLHANSPEDVIERMVTMVRYAVDLPVDAIEAQIGAAFDFIVQVKRDMQGNRFVSAVAEVAYDRFERACIITKVFERERFEEAGRWMGEAGALSDSLSSSRTSEEAGAWMG